MSDFDVVVIGAGPGGYVCAIKAAQLGLKVACIDKRGVPGGTCLNVGCIPSKALLQSSEKYHEAQHSLAAHGVALGSVSLDLPTMMQRKDAVVTHFTRGVLGLFKKNKVEWVDGAATVTAPGSIEVALNAGGARTITTKATVIATGSDAAALPFAPFDEQTILSSTGGLALNAVPEKMIVIGGGVIGLELGTVWSRLGSQVTVLEFLPNLLAGMDMGVAREMKKIVTKQGMDVRTEAKVTAIEKTENGVKVSYEPVAGGDPVTLAADKVLVSIGRRPFTAGLGLDALGVAVERGKVITDAHFRTNVPGVYAIGDVTDGPMLAHKAEDEGVALALLIAGQAGHVNYEAIPNVVYTWPEVASVGQTEEQLKQAGIPYKSGQFPFQANSRAVANADKDGFVKILAHAETDRILGAHIIGPNAGDLIHEVAVTMEFGGASEDLALSTHAHPTLSEAVKEAAMAVTGKPIHI